MKTETAKFGELLEKVYIAIHNRRVGNTTLMKMGTDNYTKPFFVIAHTKEYALNLAKVNPTSKGITLSELVEMDGWNAPAAIDHHLLETCIRQALMDFDFLQLEMKVLRSHNENLISKINKLMTVKPGQLRRLCRIFNEESKKNR